MFRLSDDELKIISRSQIATLNEFEKERGLLDDKILKSQFATSSWGGKRKLPYVFVERGISLQSIR